jgi:hypothetical protein
MHQAFKEAMVRERDAYTDSALIENPMEVAGGQVRGLLEKVRRHKQNREVA